MINNTLNIGKIKSSKKDNFLSFKKLDITQPKSKNPNIGTKYACTPIEIPKRTHQETLNCHLVSSFFITQVVSNESLEHDGQTFSCA